MLVIVAQDSTMLIAGSALTTTTESGQTGPRRLHQGAQRVLKNGMDAEIVVHMELVVKSACHRMFSRDVIEESLASLATIG